MKAAFSIVALLLIGCATAQVANKALIKPDVLITQISRIPDIATRQSGAVSVQYRVDVANRAKEAIQLKRIDLQSLGAGAYSLPPLSKPFALEIKPGESRFVELSGPAYILDPAVLMANGPVTLRMTLDYDTAGGPNQSVFVQQVFPPGD